MQLRMRPLDKGYWHACLALDVPADVDATVEEFVKRIVELSQKLFPKSSSKKRQVCLVIDGRVPELKACGDFEYHSKKYLKIKEAVKNQSYKNEGEFAEAARNWIHFSTEVKRSIVKVQTHETRTYLFWYDGVSWLRFLIRQQLSEAGIPRYNRRTMDGGLSFFESIFEADPQVITLADEWGRTAALLHKDWDLFVYGGCLDKIVSVLPHPR